MLEIHNYDPWSYAGGHPTQKSWGSDADKAALSLWVSGIQKWSQQYKIQVYYGEWGVTNSQTMATGRDDWFKAHADAISSNSWGGSVWNDGQGHLIYDYGTNTWQADIIKALGKHPAPAGPTPPPAPTPVGQCDKCGYSCDANCICGHCNAAPGCQSNSTCLTNCNSGHNAKWCGGKPTPAPVPTPAAPTPAGQCNECGYSCDANCICGHCNTKPGCESEAQCMGNCNSGGNAKWCGGGGKPTPAPATPTPAPGPVPPSCPGGSLSACIGLCPSNPPAAYKACIAECTERCKGGTPTPAPATPTPAPPAPTPPTPAGGACTGCGHNCDANCNCGKCTTDKCDTESLCMGPCNSGKNAKWCGKTTAVPSFMG